MESTVKAAGQRVPWARDTSAPDTRFNIGDKVRYGSYGDCIVTEVDRADTQRTYKVKFESWDTWVKNSALTAVADPSTCIVASTAGGPSHCPFIHANRELATAEAKRLANKHPGIEFAVYERVGAVVADIVLREVA